MGGVREGDEGCSEFKGGGVGGGRLGVIRI